VLRQRCGLNVVRDSALRFRLSEPLSDYDGADGLLAINGDMMNYVYLRDASARPGEEWRRPQVEDRLSRYGARGVDVIAGLLAEPGVELVIVRGDAPGRTVVRSAAGRGVITAEAGLLSYRAEGDDPLAYAGLGLADGVARSPRQWLEATHGAAFPDAPHRLSAVMANVTPVIWWSRPRGLRPGRRLRAGGRQLPRRARRLRADQLRVPRAERKGGPVACAARGARRTGATLLTLLGLRPEDEADGVLMRPALDPSTLVQAR
jgi:hypothetical protein